MSENEEEKLVPEDHPLYQKGREIFDVVIQICDLIPEENKELNEIKGFIIDDASKLIVKVAGAEAAEFYDLKMEAATIIRKAARDLMLQNHSLEMFGFKEIEYFDIVRDLIEEYRLLFIEWINGFDQWNYITDRWGLFNPPGVSPFDEDEDN